MPSPLLCATGSHWFNWKPPAFDRTFTFGVNGRLPGILTSTTSGLPTSSRRCRRETVLCWSWIATPRSLLSEPSAWVLVQDPGTFWAFALGYFLVLHYFLCRLIGIYTRSYTYIIYISIYIYIYTHCIIFFTGKNCVVIRLLWCVLCFYILIFYFDPNRNSSFFFHCRHRPQNLLSSSTRGRYSSIHLLVWSFRYFYRSYEIGRECDGRAEIHSLLPHMATDGGPNSKGAFRLSSSMLLLSSCDVGTYFSLTRLILHFPRDGVFFDGCDGDVSLLFCIRRLANDVIHLCFRLKLIWAEEQSWLVFIDPSIIQLIQVFWQFFPFFFFSNSV